MANIIYKTADKNVANIAERNAIARKIDGMIVIVQDAIADPNIVSGAATYTWDATAGLWRLISTATYESISFETEELTIVEGAVSPTNVITDNKIWDAHIVNGDVVVADIRPEDYTISSTSISGLESWNGLKLRFTYAYGTISQQIQTYLQDNLDALRVDLLAGVPAEGDTFAELYGLIQDTGIDTGTVTDFEGELS